ncbi:MAG TPA: M15 family metallopeptidase [Spirochaetia bacterium]|nr:M15 family metallopeptidase [Spirochaetia bacterium]
MMRLGVAAAALLCFSAVSWAQGVTIFPPPGNEGTGESEMKAFAEAYPDRISQAAQRGGDWSVDVHGAWFAWAHGRILPESKSADWKRYARFRFYPYPLGGLPPVPHLDSDSAARLKKLLEEARIHPPRRSEDFLERLFGAGTRSETVSQIVTVDFVGFPVQVNRRIAAPLSRVAAECANLRATDQQCATFFAGLSEVDGFNYRDVAGTATRSYHSYGLALDLIPRSYRGKAPYWRWVMSTTDQWWAIPYEQRWMVPLSIVAAFEKQGFVWGGKWLFFDTMHFEYRPEIFILARPRLPSIPGLGVARPSVARQHET